LGKIIIVQTDVSCKDFSDCCSEPGVHFGLIQNGPKNHGYVSLPACTKPLTVLQHFTQSFGEGGAADLATPPGSSMVPGAPGLPRGVSRCELPPLRTGGCPFPANDPKAGGFRLHLNNYRP